MFSDNSIFFLILDNINHFANSAAHIHDVHFYFRCPNALSENLTSVIGFPDYSNSEMLITNKKGSGTITENGWLAIIESGAASEMTVKINNKISYTVRLANSLTIPVTTGDTWEVTYFTANCYLWFIPNKVF